MTNIVQSLGRVTKGSLILYRKRGYENAGNAVWPNRSELPPEHLDEPEASLEWIMTLWATCSVFPTEQGRSRKPERAEGWGSSRPAKASHRECVSLHKAVERGALRRGPKRVTCPFPGNERWFGLWKLGSGQCCLFLVHITRPAIAPVAWYTENLWSG